MINIAALTEFFGWCTILNYGILAFATLMLITSTGDWAKGIHSKLFHFTKEQLDEKYFDFLANYKLAIFVFNLVPYITLKIMGS